MAVDRKRRIAIVTTIPATARAFLLPYARRLRAEGFEVVLVTSALSSCDDLAASFDAIVDIGWSRSPKHLLKQWKAWGRMRLLLRRGGYDLVHTHTPIASFITRLACFGLSRRKRPLIIYTAHGFHCVSGGPLLTNILFGLAEWIAGIWTDMLIVINQEDWRRAAQLRIVPRERLFYVPGVGIDLAAYSSEGLPATQAALIRENHGIPAGVPLVLMVAEFNRGKRHRDALIAIKNSRADNVHIAFAGTGPLEKEMQRLAIELGIGDRCHFLGFTREVPRLLHTTQIALLPSEREGLPRAVMEAMAADVPVVGADARGIRDLLQDGCGLLVPIGDVDALARAIDRILFEPDLAATLRRKARARIESYRIERLVDWHMKAYLGLSERPSQPNVPPYDSTGTGAEIFSVKPKAEISN